MPPARSRRSMRRSAARARAGVCFCSAPGGRRSKLGADVAIKEITLIPSSFYGHDHGSREFAEVVDVLAARPDMAATLITHRFGLDDAVEAFGAAGDRAAGAIKVVIHP